MTEKPFLCAFAFTFSFCRALKADSPQSGIGNMRWLWQEEIMSAPRFPTAPPTLPQCAPQPLPHWETALRMLLGVTLLATSGTFCLLILLLLLPFKKTRNRVAGAWARAVAAGVLRLTKSKFHVEGRAHLKRPATAHPVLFISNHTSMLDIILAAWLAPLGSITVGKKEILYYPLIGWLYALSGCIGIDRKKPRKAALAILKLAKSAHEHPLNVFYWPEGTRSPDGKPQRFKKGFIKLAILGGFDIIPIRVERAHLAWPNRTFSLHPTEVKVSIYPAISTQKWTNETSKEHFSKIYAFFKDTNSEF